MSTEQNGLLTAGVDAVSRARLKVLIFGPGESGGEMYKKRCELRERLKELGHNALFPEEICTAETLEKSGLNLTLFERALAYTFDYIICLMASPGSIGEAHDFGKERNLASKMIICIDCQHKNSYAAHGLLRLFEGFHGRIDWFAYPADIKECHLAARVVEQVKMVAEAKQWEIAQGSHQA